MSRIPLLGEEEERAYRLLDRLANGYPIDPELDTVQAIRDTLEVATGKIKRLVDTSRSAKVPLGVRTFWIIGESGSGKSQTLFRLRRELTSLTSLKDEGKVAVALIDFAPPQEVATTADLQLELFRRCALASSKTKERANELAEEHIKRAGVSTETAGTIVSLGLDIGFAVLNQTLPILGTLAGYFAGLFMRKAHRSRYKIRRRLLKQSEWHEYPEAVDLLIDWMLYCDEPTEYRSKELQRHAQKLADSGQLLRVLSLLLMSGGFSTLVILFDEISVLGEVEVARMLRMFRAEDPEDTKTGPTMVITACVLPGIEKVFNSDAPLNRRFWKYSDKFNLSPPRVEAASDAHDDFTHCVEKVTALARRLAYAPEIEVTDDQLAHLRNQLLERTKNGKRDNLTWQDLWVAVCDLLVPWVRNP